LTMSVHTLCDKCGKVIDKNEPYSQLTVTGVQEEIDGGVTVITTAVSYDYHTNHLPKLSKSNLDDSMTGEPEPEPEPLSVTYAEDPLPITATPAEEEKGKSILDRLRGDGS
jgi:hypothetical protein